MLAKGTRVALHDQRPPRERDLSLRDYVLSGAREPLELEAQLRRLEHAMAGGGRRATAALDRYADVTGALRGRRRLRLARARERGGPRPRLRRRRPRPVAGHVLRRPAHARLAGPGAGRAAPTCCCSTSPPTTSTSSRSSGSSRRCSTSTRPSSSSPTTAGSSRRSAPPCSSSRPGARASSRARGTRWRREQAARELALGRAIEKQQAEIARMERFVERFRYKATKARQAQSRLKKLNKIERIERDPRDGRELAFAFRPPERSGRVIFELEDGRLEVARRAVLARRRRAVARARRARLARRRQRHRQDDADRRRSWASARSTAAACARATTSRSATSPSTPRSSRAAARAPCSRRRSSAPG